MVEAVLLTLQLPVNLFECTAAPAVSVVGSTDPSVYREFVLLVSTFLIESSAAVFNVWVLQRCLLTGRVV